MSKLTNSATRFQQYTEERGEHVKRAVDIAASAIVLVALAPVFALITVVVVLDSGFPAFYSQERVGRWFRRFRVWKFRSMRQNNGPLITVAGDSRVTRVGRWLRTTKFDELPQFWNVLVGDMSLVGPRPEVSECVELYRERYWRILAVRPGITDLASIRFLKEESVLAAEPNPAQYYARHLLPAKLDLAEEYLQTRSTRLDFAILLKTIAAVLRSAEPDLNSPPKHSGN